MIEKRTKWIIMGKWNIGIFCIQLSLYKIKSLLRIKKYIRHRREWENSMVLSFWIIKDSKEWRTSNSRHKTSNHKKSQKIMWIKKYLLHSWQRRNYLSQDSWFIFHIRKLKRFCELKYIYDANSTIPRGYLFEKISKRRREGRDAIDTKRSKRRNRRKLCELIAMNLINDNVKIFFRNISCQPSFQEITEFLWIETYLGHQRRY